MPIPNIVIDGPRKHLLRPVKFLKLFNCLFIYPHLTEGANKIPEELLPLPLMCTWIGHRSRWRVSRTCACVCVCARTSKRGQICELCSGRTTRVEKLTWNNVSYARTRLQCFSLTATSTRNTFLRKGHTSRPIRVHTGRTLPSVDSVLVIIVL